jgi:hypothetical protein
MVRTPPLPAVTPEDTVTPPAIEQAPDGHDAVTAAAPMAAPRNADTVTRGAMTAKRDGVAVAHPTGRATDVMAYVAAIGLATVGVGLSVVGMVETATYALAVGGVLFCAVAVAADVLTLTMPSVIGTLWRRRSLAVILAGLLWCAGAAVTVANLAGYVGEHVEQYQAGREAMAAGRSMAIERLARLRDERRAIVEKRSPAVIAAALSDARRSERPALREALAMAKRRDVLDVELATFEQRLGEVPQVATADASAAVLSDISGTTVSEHELRRWRLALLLGLPLCGGLVLSLATALMARR